MKVESWILGNERRIISPPIIQNMSKPRRASSEARRDVVADGEQDCLVSLSIAEARNVVSLVVTFAAKIEAY